MLEALIGVLQAQLDLHLPAGIYVISYEQCFQL